MTNKKEQQKSFYDIDDMVEKRNEETIDGIVAQIAMADRIAGFVHRLRNKAVTDEMIIEILKNLEVY